MDRINYFIEFSYICGDKTQGRQLIQFIATNKGYTKIVHRSIFKSNSILRDRIFYPLFHKSLVDEFHKNLGRNFMSLFGEDVLMKFFVYPIPAGN